MTSHYKQLHVCRDPFARTTFGPKIPDGKADTSIGLKLRANSNIEVPLSTDHLLIFSPGLNQSLQYLYKIGVGDYSSTALRYPNHVANSIATTGGGYIIWCNDSDVCSWRLVSAGLKLSNIKAENSADGYWEAISVCLPEEVTRYYFYSDLNYPNTTAAEWRFSWTAVEEWIDSDTEWTKNEYYRSGPINELKDTEFILPRFEHDCVFNKLGHHWPITPVVGQTITIPDLQVIAGAPLKALATDAIQTNFDQHYRVWLIRFKGYTTPVKLLCYTESNQELIANAGSTLRRFHTEAQGDTLDPQTLYIAQSGRKRARDGEQYDTPQRAHASALEVTPEERADMPPGARLSYDAREGGLEGWADGTTEKRIIDDLIEEADRDERYISHLLGHRNKI